MTISTILFDLDGTLLDTAPDLHRSINQLLKKYERSPLLFEDVRAIASRGSPGLLKLAFNIDPEHSDYNRLRYELLDIYNETINNHTQPFDGVDNTIKFINEQGFQWGIVTNKPALLTEKLLDHYPFAKTSSCVVSGDTLEKAKPHPDPLLHACKLMNTSPKQCIFVGDGERDIIAGINAGMKTVLASYGYIHPDENADSWGADYTIGEINSLCALLLQLK